MKKLLVLTSACLLFAACGGGGSGGGSGTAAKPALEVKIDGKLVPFEVKSNWEMAQSYTDYSAKSTTALYWFALRNYAYDKPNSTILASNEKLTAPGQVLVFISLYGDKGTTDQKTPLKATTYQGDGKYSTSVAIVTVYVFGEGKDTIYSIDLGGGAAGNTGVVKITAVSGDTVTGEIDASGKGNGKDISVKGTFTAKIYRPGA